MLLKNYFLPGDLEQQIEAFRPPDLDVAFENEEDREAARNFMHLLAASESDGES